MNNSSLFTNVFKTLFGTQITPTSDQFVPITSSDATPAGISSMANLLSVLGGISKNKTYQVIKPDQGSNEQLLEDFVDNTLTETRSVVNVIIQGNNFGMAIGMKVNDTASSFLVISYAGFNKVIKASGTWTVTAI